MFAALPDAQLLAYGVPPEWLADVRQATEDTVLGLADHLPAEAAEALLELATGGTPWQPTPTVLPVDPFEHPDARRRFRVVTGVEELARALEYPWERWIVFLHPPGSSQTESRPWPSATISSGVRADLVFPLNAALSGHLAATVIEVLLIHAAYRVVSLEIAHPDGWDAERVRRVLEHHACALLRPADSMSPRLPRGAPR